MSTNGDSSESVDKLAHQAKGLLDLPGELRNQVYEQVFLSCSTLEHALAICSTNRQVRSEYLPMFFKLGKVYLHFYLHFYLVQRFLEVFFPSDATEDDKKKAVCTIRINITEFDPRGNTKVDMQWLLRFLLEHPGVNVSFFGDTVLDGVAKDLTKLVALVKTNPIWSHRLSSFASISLVFIKERGRNLTHTAIPQFYQKPGDEVYYSDDITKRLRQIRELLFDLGLVVPDGSVSGRKIFSVLKIAVYTPDRSSRVPGTHSIQLW
jgi:hypothetical protein